MDSYILNLAIKAGGVAQTVTELGNGAIAITMTDDRIVEFTAGQVLSAQMEERARVFTEQRDAHAKAELEQKRKEAQREYAENIERRIESTKEKDAG